MLSLEFFSDIILPVAPWPCGRLIILWQKRVPGVFSGGKGGRCVRLTTLPPSCAVVMISGKLNFLEPSGPLQACNGAALPSFYGKSYVSFNSRSDILECVVNVITSLDTPVEKQWRIYDGLFTGTWVFVYCKSGLINHKLLTILQSSISFHYNFALWTMYMKSTFKRESDFHYDYVHHMWT